MKEQRQLIYGIRAIMETLQSGQDLEKVFVQKNIRGDLAKSLISQLRETNTPISHVPQQKLNHLTKKNHQGMVAFVSPVKYVDLDNLMAGIYERGEVPFLVALDRITDVRNFGAIARSAEAMGVHGLVIPSRNAAQINADAMKTSAGALASLPVVRVDTLSTTIDHLKDSGCLAIGCTERGTHPLGAIALSDPIVLILGSEEDGISPEILKRSDHHLAIPMSGKIASMNVSAAGAIFMYEVARQRADQDK